MWGMRRRRGVGGAVAGIRMPRIRRWLAAGVQKSEGADGRFLRVRRIGGGPSGQGFIRRSRVEEEEGI